jgi:hypothetical protein
VTGGSIDERGGRGGGGGLVLGITVRVWGLGFRVLRLSASLCRSDMAIETQHRTTLALHPEPSTLNPKPETLNP